MADTPRGPETFKRRWRWSLGVLVVLVLVAVVLALIAYYNYDTTHPDSFQSSLAKGVLLNGAVVAILGAVVATMLSITAEFRSQQEAAADTRLGLFRRLRDAHVQVALTQQILRARRDTDTYNKQMLVLQQAVKDMEEIREEVKVSGGLYDDVDRRMIMRGIDLLCIYLNRGVSEHFKWCTTVDPSKTPDRRPDEEESWVVELVAEQHDDLLGGDKAGKPDEDSSPEPGDDEYAPPGGMPPEYDDGLEQSKLMMRYYVYGASRKERADERQKILERIAARKKAEEVGAPP